MMSTPALDKLIWVLIYGGLIAACLGLFVRSQDEGFGWTLVSVGLLAAVVGAMLVWLRSRRGP